MQVYLVQHGEAKAEAEDPTRPLTDRGRTEVQRVARHAALLGLSLAQIIHSGKLRARQTAEIMADNLWPSRGLREMAGMAPNDDPSRARAALEEAGDGVMLVGHLPHLGRLASLLLIGDAGRDIVRFRNGAIVCLARGDRGWLVRWVLTPELTGTASSG